MPSYLQEYSVIYLLKQRNPSSHFFKDDPFLIAPSIRHICGYRLGMDSYYIHNYDSHLPEWADKTAWGLLAQVHSTPAG